VNGRQLPALTGIRFLAAFVVLISHFYQRGIISIPHKLLIFLDGGRTAVVLFFVLSGFILAFNYQHLELGSQTRRFFVNRLARIYPVAMLGLAVGAVGTLVAAASQDSGLLKQWYGVGAVDMPMLLGGLVGQLSLTTSLMPLPELNQTWNGPSWSVSVEAVFYLSFPLLIVWLRKKSLRWMARAAAVGFIVQTAFVVVIVLGIPGTVGGYIVYQSPIVHYFGFFLGVAAAFVYLRGGREWLALGARRDLAVAFSSLMIILLSAADLNPRFVLITPFCAMLILGLAVPRKGRASLLGHPVLVLLGEASFALYMLHTPLMNLLSLTHPVPVVGWLLLLSTIIASIVVFKSFEQPARKAVIRWLQPSTQTRAA
jgi:peptidoglycan/LPS O-acetylase OafA/YrhL